MSKTFYEAETPEEALEIYFKGYKDLYEKTKEQVIKNVIYSMISSWNSLKVLEVGAGGGVWTEFFIKNGAAEVTCVDLCKNILIGNKKLHPEARFILADATTLALREKFDFIFAKDVIEHIEKDLRFLLNMNRHLKKDGILLITSQNLFSLNYLIEASVNFLRHKKWCGWDPTHIRFYTSNSLNRKLEMAGFRVIKYFGCYHFPYRLLTRKMFGRLIEKKIFHIIEQSRLCYKFPFNVTGWSIGVVAKKVDEA
ncbi:MAG: class I SAM-dependent methyltransferase [Nitrososphaerales archaeon]